MKPINRISWDSPNGKYRVIARRFKTNWGTQEVDTMAGTINKYDKLVIAPVNRLPKYVKEKIEDLKGQV